MPVDPNKVTNPKAVESFFNAYFPNHSRGKRLLKLAIGEALYRETDAFKKINHGEREYQFEPSETLNRNVAVIASWIKAAIKDNDPWLKDVDEHSNPKRLLHVESIEQLKKMANQDRNAKAKIFRRNLRINGGMQPTGESVDLGNEFRMVQLLGLNDFHDAGNALGNCLDEGICFRSSNEGKDEYWVLLDKNNMPHAALDVYLEHPRATIKYLIQCEGRGDGADGQRNPPSPKYMPYVQEFIRQKNYSLNHSNIRLRMPVRYTGLVDHEDVFYDVAGTSTNPKLPPMPRVIGLATLDISDVAAKLLPGFEAHELIVSDKTDLPVGLTVDTLIVKSWKNKKFPNGILVMRNLDMRGTGLTLEDIPLDTKVHRQIFTDAGTFEGVILDQRRARLLANQTVAGQRIPLAETSEIGALPAPPSPPPRNDQHQEGGTQRNQGRANENLTDDRERHHRDHGRR